MMFLHESIFSLFITENHAIVWIHSLFIHSVVGHVSCFQFGAVMDKASMNISANLFVWTSFSILLGKHIGVEFRGCMLKC